MPNSVWEFRSASVDYRVMWSWQRFEAGRTIREASESFQTLSAAMADARQHGFTAGYHKFSIV